MSKGSVCWKFSRVVEHVLPIYIVNNDHLPFIPRCPFNLLPTVGDTKVTGRSGLNEGRFSVSGAIASVKLSAHTASTMESMLDDRGNLVFRSFLKQ